MSEIKVDLRLQLERLEADAKKAGQRINSGLASSVKGLNPTSIEREDNAGKARKANRMKELRYEWAEQRRLEGLAEIAKRRGMVGRIAGAAGVPGATLGWIGAVIAAIAALKIAINRMRDALEQARRVYAKTLQSGGMGLAFIQKRSLLAEAVGVSEAQVYSYGASIEWLNQKMERASKVLSDTNPTLTHTAYHISAMKASISALAARITADFGPTISRIADLIRNTVDYLTVGMVQFSAAVTTLKAGLQILTVISGAATMVTFGFDLLAQAVVDGIQYFIRQVKNSLARRFGGEIDSSDPFIETKAKWDILKNMVKDLFARRDGDRSKMPEPVVGVNRMPFSAWEKMGLVIGGFGSKNTAEETRKNTAKTVIVLEKIANKLSMSRGATTGLNPLYSMP